MTTAAITRLASKVCIPMAAVVFVTLLVTAFVSQLQPDTLMIAQPVKTQPNLEPATNRKDSQASREISQSRLNATSTTIPVHSMLPSVCLIQSCKSDYIRHFYVADSHPIPAIRHILWRNESVTEYFAEQLRTWHRIHPDWTYVLWRDRDLEPFVGTYFPGLLTKFKSLPQHFMRVDMIRYMLLFKYGGVYADLDYSLVGNLDDFRRFHAVVTREPEAHSLAYFGPSWPLKVLANPAFLMSTPGHIFFHYTMEDLERRPTHKDDVSFAGPFCLSDILEIYARRFPIVNNALEAVYVPPSYSFYPYRNNSLKNTNSAYSRDRYPLINNVCRSIRQNDPKQQQWKANHPLSRYCMDLNNMDPITDSSQPVLAVHDLNKVRAAYDSAAGTFYSENRGDFRRVVPKLTLGCDFMRS